MEISNAESGSSVRSKLNADLSIPNFPYTYEGNSKESILIDYQSRGLLKEVKYRLKPSHVVGSGGSNYTKALESILPFTSGEYWVKFTGNDFDVTLERKIVVSTATMSTITPGVNRVADFQRFKTLIPKFLLQSGTGAATVDVEISVVNPKTMAETRVYVERWALDDGTTFGDKSWYPPRVSTKYLQSITSFPFYDRMRLLGVSGTLNSADYLFEKVQAAYTSIKTSFTISTSDVNDRGYVVVPFTCNESNCLQITLNNSAGASTISDQFVIVRR